MVPIVSLKNLYYRYPDGTRVLHGISADICKGERVGLVGPNGAGKSTLLLHLNGILGATQGSVEIMGVPLAKGNLKIIRQRVGLVFQDPDDQLFMPTVFDDVAFGPTNAGIVKYEVQMRVQEALQRVGMTGFEERCSHQLSFGEKKKISLATVLSMNLDLLVLD